MQITEIGVAFRIDRRLVSKIEISFSARPTINNIIVGFKQWLPTSRTLFLCALVATTTCREQQ